MTLYSIFDMAFEAACVFVAITIAVVAVTVFMAIVATVSQYILRKIGIDI